MRKQKHTVGELVVSIVFATVVVAVFVAFFGLFFPIRVSDSQVGTVVDKYEGIWGKSLVIDTGAEYISTNVSINVYYSYDIGDKLEYKNISNLYNMYLVARIEEPVR